MVHLVQVTSGDYLEHARQLFKEYADSIAIDLSLQDFEKELSSLPGDYQCPEGCLLLALADELPVGCVALRKKEDGVCELKRLYVKPPFRREGLGRKLALKLIHFARTAGYKRMLLHTLPSMKEATSLYHSLGFREIEPCLPVPVKDAIHLELTL